jgi:hypothetical protein
MNRAVTTSPPSAAAKTTSRALVLDALPVPARPRQRCNYEKDADLNREAVDSRTAATSILLTEPSADGQEEHVLS